MKTTDANVDGLSARIVEEWGWFHQFPDTLPKLLSYTRAILRIVQDKPLYSLPTEDDPDSKEARPMAPEGFLGYPGEIPEGVVTDIDWLFRQVAGAFTRLPAPIEVYRIYNRIFQPENQDEIRSACAALED